MAIELEDFDFGFTTMAEEDIKAEGNDKALCRCSYSIMY